MENIGGVLITIILAIGIAYLTFKGFYRGKDKSQGNCCSGSSCGGKCSSCK